MPPKASRAYDNLTEAVARAKKVCRIHAKLQSPIKVASKIPKMQNKRGRPKGSKDSKPRNKKQLTSQSALSNDPDFESLDLTLNQNHFCESGGSQSSHEGLNEDPIMAEGLIRDHDPSSLDSSSFRSEAVNSTEQSTICQDLQNSNPACWVLPLP